MVVIAHYIHRSCRLIIESWDPFLEFCLLQVHLLLYLDATQALGGHQGNKEHLCKIPTLGLTYRYNSEKAMAPHSSTLAWKIPWMEEPGRLQSLGSLRVGHDWATFLSHFTFHALGKEMATHSSVLAWRIPGMGEPGGLPSMGSHRVGHHWRDLTAAAACSML